MHVTRNINTNLIGQRNGPHWHSKFGKSFVKAFDVGAVGEQGGDLEGASVTVCGGARGASVTVCGCMTCANVMIPQP